MHAPIEQTVDRKKRPWVNGWSSAQQQQAEPPDGPHLRYLPQAELDDLLAELEALSEAAKAGDTEAVDQLRVALDEHPHVWQMIGDLQRDVEHQLVHLIAGDDPLRRECFRKRCSELRAQIKSGGASTATQMAASRMVMTWLFVQLLDLRYLEVPDDRCAIKRLEQAERRHLTATRAFKLMTELDQQLAVGDG